MFDASRKTLFRLHAWIGLSLGYVLYVICLSGTVATFSAELAWLGDPSLRSQPAAAGGQPAGWQQIHDRVAAAHPDARILLIQAAPGPRSLARVAIQVPGGDIRLVPVDPWTAEPRPARAGLGLAQFLRVFHKQLYLVASVAGFHGTLVVGALGAALLLALVAGLISIRRWWRAFYTLRAGRSARLFWSDLHRMLGVWALVIGIILSVTGLWYFAETALEGVGVRLDREPPLPVVTSADMAGDPAPLADLDRVVARVQAAFPALTVQDIALPAAPGRPLVLTGPADAWVVRDRANRVAVDPASGAILEIRPATALGAYDRWVQTADPLHFGTFGGLASRVVWCLAGLALSGGILAGLYGAWLRLDAPAGRRQATGRSRGYRRLSVIATVTPAILLMTAAAHGSWAYGVVAARPTGAADGVQLGLSWGEGVILAVFGLLLLVPLIGWVRLQARR